MRKLHPVGAPGWLAAPYASPNFTPRRCKVTTELPFFKLFAKDFMTSRAFILMNGLERGVYFSVLLAEWIDGPLPNDAQQLSRLSCITYSEFKKAWRVVSQRFKISDDGGKIWNKRLEDERQELTENYEQKSQVGRVAANARWHTKRNANAMQTHGIGNASGNANALHPQCQSESDPESESEEERNLENTKDTQRTPAVPAAPLGSPKPPSGPDHAQALVDLFVAATAKRTTLTPKRRKLIREAVKALGVGPCTTALKNFIREIQEHAQGVPDGKFDRTKFSAIEYCFKNLETVERWINWRPSKKLTGAGKIGAGDIGKDYRLEEGFDGRTLDELEAHREKRRKELEAQGVTL